MDMQWGSVRFRTQVAHDNAEGWSAIELTRHAGSAVERVARIVFWDAVWQFSLEMFTRELPLGVVEALIAKAKQSIRTA